MMIWLIIGNGTSHRKTSGVVSQPIDKATLALIALACADKTDAISRLWRIVWDAFSGYEKLPSSCKELLPIAASNVQSLGVALSTLPFPRDLSSKVLVGKCKAIWTRNTLVLNKAKQWGRLLQDSGANAVAIKGVASISSDPVLARGRQALDVDLWVQQEHWDLAVNTLARSRSFKEYDAPAQWDPSRGWVRVHAQHFRGDIVELDLHHHPQPGYLEDLAPFHFLQSTSRALECIRIPQMGDHLSILMLHGFSAANAQTGSNIRYIAEVLRLLPKASRDDLKVMEDQLSMHDHGSRMSDQIWRLKRVIEMKLA